LKTLQADSTVEKFQRLYIELRTIRDYAESGELDPKAVFLLSEPMREALQTDASLKQTLKWARTFRDTFTYLDDSIVQSGAGRRFANREWELGVEAEEIALSALQERLEAAAARV
jgi:hypothetical protein